MSSESLVFSHQPEVVFALSRSFDFIDVFTTERNQVPLPKNVKVTELKWRENDPWNNVINIYKTLGPFLVRNRKSLIFTHMADVHAALISPLTFLLRMRHTLWYAHAKNSFYLVWSSFFVSRIVSSTLGSCNLTVNKDKIRYINQGIKHKAFPYSNRIIGKVTKFLYFGRLDKSKNIHKLIKLVPMINDGKNRAFIDIYGNPVGMDSDKYIKEIKVNPNVIAPNAPIRFKGPLKRNDIPKISIEYDCFLNLFSGSLDKTLIEATLLGLPVVTWNREYCNEFGAWSLEPVEETQEFIINEISAIRKMDTLKLKRELHRRYQLARSNHSFERWIDMLTLEIQGDNNS